MNQNIDIDLKYVTENRYVVLIDSRCNDWAVDLCDRILRADVAFKEYLRYEPG